MNNTTYVTTLFALLVSLVHTSLVADDWPQWRGPQRDGVWRETGITDKLNTDADGQIKLKWSVPIAAGYTQPTVADGRVYVTDRIDEDEELERIHCFDFKTGDKQWTVQYPVLYNIGYKSGPRAAVLIDRDEAAGKTVSRAYALGGVGHLHCLDAKTGDILWKRDLARQYNIEMPRWGIAAAPLVEGDLLILHIGGQPNACIVALDKRSGEEKWRAVDDDASYTAPIVINQAGRRVLIVYTADFLVGLDPKTGEKLYAYELPGSKWPISVASPVVATHNNKRYIFTTNPHVGAALVRLDEEKPAVTEVWRQQNHRVADSLYSLIPTPHIRGGHIYGTHTEGELRCLELLTGKQVWESTAAVKSARFATLHIVAQGDTGNRVWIFNEHGELIIAELSPAGYKQISRGQLLPPTRPGLPSRRGGVTWAHPAFAQRHVIARNDEKLVCADLSARDNAE